MRPHELYGNIPPVFRHSKTPHVFGKRLLGAYQMAGGIFLIKRQSSMVKVTTPVSCTGYVFRIKDGSRNTLNDTGIVTVTQTDLYV